MVLASVRKWAKDTEQTNSRTPVTRTCKQQRSARPQLMDSSWKQSLAVLDSNFCGRVQPTQA